MSEPDISFNARGDIATESFAGVHACWLAVVSAALLAIVATVLLSASPRLPSETARPTTEVRPLSCEKLVDIPGKSITTALIIFPPRAYTPAHRHPGAVTAFVVRGSIRSQMEGTSPQTYAAGSTWFEPAGALHLFAENPSTSETAQLLAVFVTDHDCGPLVIPEHHGSGSP